MRIFVLSLAILLSTLTYAQVTDVFGNKVPTKKPRTNQSNNSNINKTDSRGLKQGKWEKKYPNGRLAYSVTFKDNKPVGEMLRFYESGNIKALIMYDENSVLGKAELFYPEGRKIQAKGIYKGKKKHGKWEYFLKEGMLNSTENYTSGIKNGTTTYYYRNGNKSEEVNWVNNKKEGIWMEYYESGARRTKAFYENGNLNGDYWVYHENGKVEVQGQFVDGVEDGEWVIFSPNGNFLYNIKYNDGVVMNEDDMSNKQRKMFEEFEKNKGNLKDPEEFKEDPDGYIRSY